MSELPADWRAHVAQMVVGPTAPTPDVAAAWFHGGTGLDASGQIGVYRDQLILRLGGAVRDACPTWLWAAGPDADALILRYLREAPSTSWTLDRIADRLPAWLASIGAPERQVHAASVDVAVRQAFVAGVGAVPDAAELRPDTPLAHTPSLTLLHLGAPWHQVRRALVAGQEVHEPDPTERFVAIYRVGEQVRDRALDPLEFDLLAAFAGGATLVQAITSVVEGGADGAALQPHIGPWFQRFGERGLLVLAP